MDFDPSDFDAATPDPLTPREVEVLSFALQYARMGIAVFPCRPNSKHPAIKSDVSPWGSTSDLDEVEAYWTGVYRGHNIGVVTGGVIWGVDVDTKGGSDGHATLAGLIAQNGPLPDTVRVLTPSGGMHYWWSHVAGIRNSAGKLGKGLDTRGEGGYLLAPPSVIGGEPYRFSDPIDLFPVASAPQWLIDMALGTERQETNRVEIKPASTGSFLKAFSGDPSGRYVQRAIDAEFSAVATAGPGTRNNQLNISTFKLATMAGAGWVGADVVVSTMTAAGRACGLDDTEIRATVASALRGGMQSPRQPLPPREGAPERGNPFMEWTDPTTGEIHDSPFEPAATLPAAAVTPLRSVDFTTLYNEQAVEEPDYIEEGFAGPGNFVLIAGPPKAQKSFLLQELLVSCALGRPFLAGTFNVPRPLRVYYLQAEMNRKLLRKRAKAMKGLTGGDLGRLSTNLYASERFQMLLDENGVASVVAEIKAVYPGSPPDIIAIDPFANVYDGESENDNAQIMRFLVTRVEQVRQRVNPAAAVVMVHHATKAKAEDMARDPFVLIRGAGALRGYYDSAIVIFRKNEETKARKIHFELRSGESPEPMEVELHEGVFVKTSALVGVTTDTSRVILRAMGQAFRDGEPWNDNREAARYGRGALENMVRYGVTRDAAAVLLNGWVENDIIKLRPRAKVGGLMRPAGYEVTGHI